MNSRVWRNVEESLDFVISYHFWLQDPERNAFQRGLSMYTGSLSGLDSEDMVL